MPRINSSTSRTCAINLTIRRHLLNDNPYNLDGLIESVTDFTGRQITYDYYEDGDEGGSAGDLKAQGIPLHSPSESLATTLPLTNVT